MRTLLILGLAFGLAAVHATTADPKDSDNRKEGADKLVGTWMVVGGEVDGKPSPEEKIKGSMMTVDKKSIKLTDKDDKQLWVLNYKTDDMATPHRISMTVEAGTDNGKSAEGIYKIDGDTLTICYGLPGAERPKDFKTTTGSKENCFVLKRVAANRPRPPHPPPTR